MVSPSSTPRQVFRQRSSLLLAAVCAVTGLVLLFSLARNWSSDPQPLFVAWVFLGLAFTWAIFVRPAVVFDDRGVTLRNVLRDVHIPWARVTTVTSRWNVRVFAGDKGYVAWAISSQAERPRPTSSGMFSPRPARLQHVTNVPRVPHPSVVSKVSASSVTDAIKTAKQEYDETPSPGSGDDLVRVRWVPVVVVVLLGAVLAVLGLTILG